MYVIRRSRPEHVVLHRADCALLDGEFYELGEHQRAESFDGASAWAQALARPYGRAHHVCGWCRPSEAAAIAEASETAEAA
jgi:hypothetical protein